MSKCKSAGVKIASACALVLALILSSKGVYADGGQRGARATSYISIYETVFPEAGARRGTSQIHRTLARALADADPGETVKTWVFFKDKGISSTRAYAAAIDDVASKYNRRAIDRRQKRRTLPGLFDERDLPVLPTYIAQVEATGAQVHTASKWLNAVSVYATKEQVDQIDELEFVKLMQPVRHSRKTNPRAGFDPKAPREETVYRDLAQGGDTCASATVIPGIPFHDTGTTLGYSDDYDESCTSADPGAPDVVYSYEPATDMVVTIELCNGSDYNTKLYVYENTCESGALVACNDNECGYSYGYGPSAIHEFPVASGNTYYIVIDGSSAGETEDAGNYVLDISEGGFFYGQAYQQLEQINLIAVHDLGFTGKNVVIGVMEGGFDREHPVFNHPLHPLHVIAEWDFVNNDPDASAGPDDPAWSSHHGDWTLGVLASYMPDVLVAGAYDASYILCKTEDVAAEYPQEEDNYIAGLEFIEAHGGDVINSSLGYIDWYDQTDLDGLTAVSTIGANIATANGLHYCNCAGNEDHDDDPLVSHLIAPNDAFEVISVGAVWSDGSITDFSSDGPTADGRVKPEVLARGENTRSINPIDDEGYMGIGGTSFSSPLAASAVACLVDAFPDWSVQKMREALFSTADYYVANGTFDPLYIRGYGIIDALAALRADCNDNDVDDIVDISGGGSLDCNGNDIPDECEEDCDGDDIPDDCETFADCNNNGRPDECDFDCDSDGIPDDCEINPAEQDCDGDGICNAAHIADCPVDNVFCADCDGNGIPDLCDLREGTLSDADVDHVPDECSAPPVYALPPHDTRKNRYISVNADTNGFDPVAMQVSLSSMLRCSGDPGAACSVDDDCETATEPCAEHPSVGTVLGWASAPRDASCTDQDGISNGNPCTGDYVSRIVEEPVFRRWAAEDVVHISDCEIVPVATYDLRLSKDGVVLSPPLFVGTILKAAPWHYGDTVGVGTGDLPPLPGFTPPNQIVNVNDVTAYLLTVKGDTTPSAHTTWVDLHGLGVGVPPNYILNVSDLQRILFGLEGQTYNHAADQLNPADCP